MEKQWVSVKEKLPPSGEGKVQVCFLSPFFGKLTLEQAIGYYDNPEDYESGGDGWLTWDHNREILVTHWKSLDEKPKSEFDGMEQKEFGEKFGSFRPNLGSVY